MVVRSIGNSLMVILPDLLGKKITNWFDLVRPLIAFKFQTVSVLIYFILYIFYKRNLFFQILNRTNNIFELVTVESALATKHVEKHKKKDQILFSDEIESTEKTLRLKGTFKY